jgi:hypothetical protein
MDDDEIEQRMRTLEACVTAAQGEALFAGILIGPLLNLLADSGALSELAVKTLIDGALLLLEKHRASALPEGQAAIDQARGRLEAQLRYHS